MRDALCAVAEHRQIVIFPEGTRPQPVTVLLLQPGMRRDELLRELEAALRVNPELLSQTAA